MSEVQIEVIPEQQQKNQNKKERQPKVQKPVEQKPEGLEPEKKQEKKPKQEPKVDIKVETAPAQPQAKKNADKEKSEYRPRNPEFEKLRLEQMTLRNNVELLKIKNGEIYESIQLKQKELQEIYNQQKETNFQNKDKVVSVKSLYEQIDALNAEKTLIKDEIDKYHSVISKQQDLFKTKNPNSEDMRQKIEDLENYREHNNLSKEEEKKNKIEQAKLKESLLQIDEYKANVVLQDKRYKKQKEINDQLKPLFDQKKAIQETMVKTNASEQIDLVKAEIETLKQSVESTRDKINKHYEQINVIKAKMEVIKTADDKIRLEKQAEWEKKNAQKKEQEAKKEVEADVQIEVK
ncbi:Hypothetical_protein [Hexamita inflata]|uniref:Hypothetical_protein n=1 Tax=Hexamita inflata TaxID=28002 RepID=A0AA86RPY3_9EUKA|nr:Hypothetical protein HINF_LOCUS63577 [Hexamita inflata]